MAQRIFKPGNTFRGFAFRFLQKPEPQQLLLVSCMTGLRYFLTKGLTPVTVDGREVQMRLFKQLQISVAVEVVQIPRY